MGLKKNLLLFFCERNIAIKYLLMTYILIDDSTTLSEKPFDVDST